MERPEKTMEQRVESIRLTRKKRIEELEEEQKDKVANYFVEFTEAFRYLYNPHKNLKLSYITTT